MRSNKPAVEVLATLSFLGLLTAEPVSAQVLSKWGHPVISLGLTPYDTVNTGHGNYPGSPGFIPGYGYYPGPGPGHYPWADGPGTPFDRRKLVVPLVADGIALPPPVQEGVPPEAALIVVKLPAEAELWFNEVKTTQGGSYRRFVTPALPRDRELSYTLRVRWRIKDAELSRSEEIRIRPGERFTVNFLTTDSWKGKRIGPVQEEQ
jgi:uncharacterized protein (TIGR03000 family)